MLVPGLVNSATSHAVNRHIDTLKGVKTRDSIKDAKIAQADFERALQDITPAFGTSENAFEGFPDKDIIMYSEHVQVRSRAPGAVTTVTEARHLTAGVTPAFTGMRRCGGTAQEIINDGELYIKQVQQSQFSPMAAVLLHGPLGRCGWQRRRKGLSSLKKGGRRDEEGRAPQRARTVCVPSHRPPQLGQNGAGGLAGASIAVSLHSPHIARDARGLHRAGQVRRHQQGELGQADRRIRRFRDARGARRTLTAARGTDPQPVC